MDVRHGCWFLGWAFFASTAVFVLVNVLTTRTSYNDLLVKVIFSGSYVIVSFGVFWLLIYGLVILGPLAVLNPIRVTDAVLRARGPWSTILACLLVWPVTRLGLVLIGRLRSGSADSFSLLDAFDSWSPGVAWILFAFTVSLPEEVVFRAIILGVGYSLLRSRTTTFTALLFASLLSLVLLALQRVLTAAVEGLDVGAALLTTVPAGVAYGVLFVIFRNLYFVAAVHGVALVLISPFFNPVGGGAVNQAADGVTILVIGLVAGIPLALHRYRHGPRSLVADPPLAAVRPEGNSARPALT